MLPQGPIEPDPESRADIPMMLGDCDFQAGLNSQDLSVAAATAVGTSTSTFVMSDSVSKPGISASTETAGMSFPVGPDWLDWQDINSTSPTPPELLVNTLTNPFDLEALNMNSPIAADSSSKIKITDPIWAELYEHCNPSLTVS